MFNLDSYCILNRQVTPIIKIYSVIVVILVLSLLLIITTFEYRSYYETIGVVTLIDDKYYLIISSLLEDQKYLIANNQLYIDNRQYLYRIDHLDSQLQLDTNGNYRLFYLEVNLDHQYCIANLALNIKILKDKKTIIDYLFSK